VKPAARAIDVLRSCQSWIITDCRGHVTEHISDFLPENVPVDEWLRRLFRVSASSTCIHKRASALLFLGVQHGGVVWTKAHQESCVLQLRLSSSPMSKISSSSSSPSSYIAASYCCCCSSSSSFQLSAIVLSVCWVLISKEELSVVGGCCSNVKKPELREVFTA
jgi:hypothetical protein